jgi:preprotein translocase subunit YajC
VITQLATLLAQDNAEGGSIFGLLILLVPLGAILYMTIVPQRKARQRQADMLRKIDVGDEVLTTGGIVGVITFVEDDLYHLEVDNDVVIRIAKTAVARSMSDPDPAAQPASRTRRGLLGSGAVSKDADAAAEGDESPGGDDDK